MLGIAAKEPERFDYETKCGHRFRRSSLANRRPLKFPPNPPPVPVAPGANIQPVTASLPTPVITKPSLSFDLSHNALTAHERARFLTRSLIAHSLTRTPSLLNTAALRYPTQQPVPSNHKSPEKRLHAFLLLHRLLHDPPLPPPASPRLAVRGSFVAVRSPPGVCGEGGVTVAG